MKTQKSAAYLISLVWMMGTTAQAKPIKTDDLSNLIIQGQNRLHVNAPTIDVAWAPDMYRDFSNLMRDDVLVGSLKTPALSEPPVTFPSPFRSQKTASPWLHAVHVGPVLTLAVKPGKNDNKVEWVFLVKDSQGKLFYEQRKKGLMPEKIEWDGFGKNGQPLQVGFDYAYSLSIVDQAGNPQRFSGKPFSLPGFRTGSSGRMVTSLTPGFLFKDESSIKLSMDGIKALAEARDSLRRQFSKKIEVVSYESDSKFALARSNTVAKHLINLLEYDESQVQAKAGTMTGPKGYRHVEIIAK